MESTSDTNTISDSVLSIENTSATYSEPIVRIPHRARGKPEGKQLSWTRPVSSWEAEGHTQASRAGSWSATVTLVVSLALRFGFVLQPSPINWQSWRANSPIKTGFVAAGDCIVHWEAFGHCSFLTDLNLYSREALHQRVQSMLVSGQVCFLAINAGLSKHVSPDHGGKFVETSIADIDLFGIVCVDISRMTASPKSIWGPTGGSGGSWCEFNGIFGQIRL